MSPDRQAGYDPLGLSEDPGAQAIALRLRMASPVIGDEEMAAVRSALESGVLTNGPWTRRFEHAMAERHDTEHAVAMANGTVALAAMLLAGGVGPGDEVIVPSFTFIATATAVLHVGATPVFADVDGQTFCLDPDDVEQRVTSRTRAIIPVHYAGQMADMARFRDLADAHGLLLFEDAAQAHGSSMSERSAGAWGDAAMFSFTPIKTITTGEGAMVTTNDANLAYQMRLLRNHGMDKQYHHEILGFNWRITEMQAAIGVCQLDRLDQILSVKQRNADTFRSQLEGLDGVATPQVAPNRFHPFTLYTLLFPTERRDAVAAALEAAGIETRIYFPPAHRQPIFVGCPSSGHGLRVTESLADRVLSVPFHSRITESDLAEMADVIRSVVSGS